MSLLVIGLLAALALVYVGAPLRGGRAEAGGGTVDPGAEADAARRAALSAIVDLESERDVGKLSESDFEELRSEYEERALAALRVRAAADRQADDRSDLRPAGRADDALEAEIAAARERLRCPSCGAPRAAGPCTSCGS